MGPGFESLKVHHIVSVFYVQGPPVPIPNTVVKLLSAEDTRLEATWENRSRPTFLFLHSSMAEHPAVNRRVVSSSLTGGATKPLWSNRMEGVFCFCLYCVSFAFLV